MFMDFPGGSTGKESSHSVKDLGLIPGLGRSSGEGNSFPLQYSDLENSMDCSPPGFSAHGDSPGQNTGVGSLSLLQKIFPTQRLNPGLSHCQVDSLPAELPGKPNYFTIFYYCLFTIYTIYYYLYS